MQNNPEIDAVVNNATTIAVGHKHGYVLTEHVLLAMVQYPSFRKILEKYGTPVEQLESELHNYLQSQTSLLTDRTDPPGGRPSPAAKRSTLAHGDLTARPIGPHTARPAPQTAPNNPSADALPVGGSDRNDPDLHPADASRPRRSPEEHDHDR